MTSEIGTIFWNKIKQALMCHPSSVELSNSSTIGDAPECYESVDRNPPRRLCSWLVKIARASCGPRVDTIGDGASGAECGEDRKVDYNVEIGLFLDFASF